MNDPQLTEEQRMRAQEHRLAPNATDHEIASAFVYGCGNMYRDRVAVMALEAILASVRGDERRKIGDEMGHVANRIFNHQQQDFPSNVLDKVAAHLRCGEPLYPPPRGALTQCECGQPLPVHFLDLVDDRFRHVCSCERRYRADHVTGSEGGPRVFVLDGTEANPFARSQANVDAQAERGAQYSLDRIKRIREGND